MLATRPVLGDDLDARRIQQQRRGQQPPFEASVLLGAQLAGVEFDGGQLGAFAFDRVEQRTPQRLGLDSALDQIS